MFKILIICLVMLLFISPVSCSYITNTTSLYDSNNTVITNNVSITLGEGSYCSVVRNGVIEEIKG